jgi:PAS domain S-box-containing protein
MIYHFNNVGGFELENSGEEKNLSNRLNLLESRIAELEKELALKEIQLADSKLEKRYDAEELRKSHATLNSIFEGPENIIAFSLDCNYQYIFFNQAHSQTMKNIWGVDIEIGKSMLDYLSLPEDRKKAKINFDRALSGENFIELEDYGEETLSRRYWENIYNPVQSGNEIIGLTVFCVDITERKKAEREIKESEEKFRAVSEYAIDAIITTDSKGIITFFNHSLLELFGYSASKLSGKPLSTLIPERHKNGHHKGMKSFKSGKTYRTGKTSMAIGLKKDGTEFPFEMSVSVWKSGNETYFTAIIRDLTERKKAEDELIKAKDEWESTFNAVPDLIALLDTNFQVIRANKALADRLGVTVEEAVGLPCYKAVHNLNAPPLFCPHLKLLEDGQEHTAEVHEDIIGGDFIVSVSPLYDSEGKLTGSVHVARDITDRKMAEEALKESEEKFRGIFNNANDMISLNLMNDNGMPGKFLEVNEVASKRLGYTRDEFLNMSPPDIVAPEKLSEMPENARMLLKNGHNTFEIVHLTKGGKKIVVEVNNHLIDYKGQQICLAITRDIRLRKKVEKALKDSEEKYRAIFENVQDIFYQTDIDGKIIEISPSSKIYSQFTREELIGKSVDIIYYDPDDRNKLLKAIQEKGEVFDYEIRLKDKDGRLVNASANAHFILDSKNQPIGVEGSLRDITQRKKMEEDLRLSQIRLANAMDLANLANWELDIYNMMFTFNDKFYSMLGTTAEKEGSYSVPIEHYITEYVHPEDAQFIAEGMKKSLELHEPTFGTKIEHRVIRRDGEIRYFAIDIRLIPATENQNVRVYGAVQDVTDSKIVEEKLKESLEEKEMLLKEIHHRVKNNLMVISSLLNLQSRYIKDKKALDIFKESQNRAKSMALIHERLYRSKDLKKIDFGDYIHTLATDLFHTYVTDSSRIKLNMNVENVMVDINTTVPLGLIVNEIVTNSMKHAFPEGRKGDINIEFYKKDDEFTLKVSDNGVGFPEGIDFRNTDSLGLQLVTNLVMQIDGEITLDKSHGTEFIIVFKEVEYKKKK